MVKAVREAKVRSSWINVNARYEAAVSDFVGALLGKLEGNLFLDDFAAAQRLIAWLGMLYSLSQTLIKVTSPGAGHLQGNELWDFSLVDPDNRRPVDFGRRWALLDEIAALAEQPSLARAAAVRSMLDRLDDGRAKLLVIHAALRSRRAHGEVFQKGAYVPLSADAPHDQRIIAFARRFEKHGVIVVAPRLLARLVEQPGMLPLGAPTWGETRLALPWLAPEARLEDLLTGRSLSIEKDERGAVLALAEVLRDFPVGLLFFTTPADGS
jgi:(1->4)-alpha-D-glucan 1-alpha-D-glucosylmutase